MKDFWVDDENLSPKEVKKIEEEIRNTYKKIDENKDLLDYSFDSEFDTAIESKYYEPESGCVVFVSMEYQLNNLYRYFQYTKRFVAFHEKEANEYYYGKMKAAESAEEESVAFDAALGDALSQLTCQSILIMTYSAFEAFLRDIIDMVGDDRGILRFPKDEFTALKYINYLNTKNIFVPKVLYRQFDEMRLVRNYFAHSLENVQGKLISYLKHDEYSILQEKRIVLNHNYIEHTFDIFGKLVKSVENVFMENYE